MQPIVALWIIVLLILLTLTIFYKDHTSAATATVLETDCVLVKNAEPCVSKVKYEVNGATYVQQIVSKPSPNSIVGMTMPIKYNNMFPNLAQPYQKQVNIFAIPTVVWLLIGIAVLYFMYYPITLS